MAWARRRTSQNIRLKLLAIAIAILLWSLVRNQPKVETVLEAHVNYVNLPSEFELNPKQINHLIVTVRGSRGEIEELRRREVSMTVDFAEVDQLGQQTFDVTAASLDLPDGLDLVRSIPSQVRPSLGKQSRRSVIVQPVFVDSADDSRTVSFFQVMPPRLTISGPKRQLALITHVATDPIAITALVGKHRVVTTAYVPDPYIRFDGDTSVTVEFSLEK